MILMIHNKEVPDSNMQKWYTQNVHSIKCRRNVHGRQFQPKIIRQNQRISRKFLKRWKIEKNFMKQMNYVTLMSLGQQITKISISI